MSGGDKENRQGASPDEGWDPNALPDEEEEKRRRRERRRREREQQHAEADAAEGAGEEAEVGEGPVLTASAKEPPKPWKMSLYIGLAGLVLAVILLFWTGIQQTPVPGVGRIPTAWFLVIFPLLSVIFTVVGFREETYLTEQAKGLIGLAVSIAAIVVIYIAASAAGAEERAQQEMEQMRENMTEEELREWRMRKLRGN
jgi:hypothetical protein